MINYSKEAMAADLLAEGNPAGLSGDEVAAYTGHFQDAAKKSRFRVRGKVKKAQRIEAKMISRMDDDTKYAAALRKIVAHLRSN